MSLAVGTKVRLTYDGLSKAMSFMSLFIELSEYYAPTVVGVDDRTLPTIYYVGFPDARIIGGRRKRWGFVEGDLEVIENDGQDHEGAR